MSRIHFLLLALLLCASVAQAGINQWTTTGPEGGFIDSVTLLPSQPGVALAAGADTIYRTTDHGMSWTKVITGRPSRPHHFVVDPSNGNRVLLSEPAPSSGASSGTLFRSNDGGVTFTSTPFPNGMSISVLAFSADGTVLYGGSGGTGRAYVSTDLGAHWTEISNGLPGDASYEPVAIAVDPTDRDTVYLSIQDKGVFRSTDRGQNWLPAGFAGGARVRQIAIDPTNTSRILAAVNDGLWMSLNSGVSWAKVNAPLSSYAWVGFDRADPTKVLAVGGDTFFATTTHIASGNWQLLPGSFIGFPHGASFDSGRVIVGSSNGVHVSLDAGTTVVTRNRGIYSSSASQLVAAADGSLYSAFYSGLAGAYQRDGASWNPLNLDEMFMLFGQQPGVGLVPNLQSFAVAHTDSRMMYAVGARGAIRSTDGGAHWSKASTQFDAEEMWRVAVDPKDPQIAYVTTLLNGLWRTADGGSSWERRTHGLPAGGMGALAIDPINPNVVYTVNQGSPATLYRSTDAGLHWAPSGLTRIAIMSVAIDPLHPEIVYAVCFEDVYRSADSGATWKPLNVGRLVRELLIDPQVPSVLTALVAGVGRGARSVDSGETWEVLSTEPHSIPTELLHGVLDPLRPHHIYAGTNMAGLVELEVSPDLRLTIASLPTPMTKSTTTPATLSVNNLGPFAASDVKLSLTLPAWLTVTSPPVGCSVSGSNVTCALGVVRKGSSVTQIIGLTVANVEDSGTLVASVSGHESDPDQGNNTVTLAVAAVTPATPSTPSGNGGTGGGGGGPLHWYEVLLLAGLAGGRLATLRRRPARACAGLHPE